MTSTARLTRNRGRSQRGVSLLVSMVLLAAITVLTLVSARSTLLELNMAGNQQHRITAFEKSAAALDQLFENRASVVDFNTIVGYTKCSSNVTADCDEDTGTIDLPSTDGFDSKSKVWVQRVGEAELVCPPAFLQISCTDNKAAFFEFRSQYDARAERGGNVVTTQGVLSVLPDQE